MRPLICSTFVAFFLLVSLADAEQKKRTDAQTDELHGHIKSVITTTFRHEILWQQPNGISLVLPAYCLECDYDLDGAKVKTENSTILILRDTQGRITDRRILDATSGSLEFHEIFGPFGLTEQRSYENGKMSSSRVFGYDLFGHVSETHSFDSGGEQVERTHSTYGKDGELIEDSNWGKNDQLRWQDLLDSQAQTRRFTSFDEDGKVKLAWLRKDEKMVFFWQHSDEENQFGDCQTQAEANDGTQETHCFASENRERAVIRYRYIGPKETQLLKSAEWCDGTGILLYGAYYEYELDGHQNWNRRVVSVVSPQLSERTLLEEDTRVIVYW